ncbi:hypothetical protein TNCV_2866091 [Trichonephila clavipes]|nr:hypothetical protein TNCV_2866091 [Trichonephila clavipes]
MLPGADPRHLPIRNYCVCERDTLFGYKELVRKMPRFGVIEVKKVTGAAGSRLPEDQRAVIRTSARRRYRIFVAAAPAIDLRQNHRTAIRT